METSFENRSDLVPSKDLAKKNQIHNPNESAEYRKARNELLNEEIELRRHAERVAQLRRGLPRGGEVKKPYKFDSTTGEKTLLELFGDKETLIIYSYMFGEKREKPCPMCTSFMRSWSEKISDVQQRVSYVFLARSPIEKLVKDAKTRGMSKLPLYADLSGEYTRDYVSKEDEDMPGMNVFMKRDGRIFHFWRNEMSQDMADPGQDARGPLDPDPLWNLLDLTPGGRDAHWYPKLEY